MLNKPGAAGLAIQRGLAYLDQRQQADGGFISFSSPSNRPFEPAIACRTNFVPALMLASLSAVEDNAARSIRGRLARFLLAQKSPTWSFNYWATSAAQRQTHPYPDDLDDTFCALIGLYLHNPSIISEEVLAKVVKLLIATETAAGGPYRTWLVPPTADKIWLDTDLAVNGNIAYFLSLVSNTLPNLNALMEQAILGERLVSPYYPSPYPLVYYCSRVYQGSQTGKLINIVRQLQKAKAATTLDQALCLTALVRLGETRRLDASAAKLMSSQQEDGSWAAEAFCLDPARSGKTYYHGAAELTTAFAIEALRLYHDGELSTATGTASQATAPNHTEKLRASVLSIAKRRCQSLDKDLRSGSLNQLRELATGTNGPEIITLPYYFNKSLLKPLVATDSFFETLGLANLYGWMAYTIYDDFLDEEGQPELISVANVAMRGSLRCFAETLPANQEFQRHVLETFDKIDGANAWELAHCRFDCYDGVLLVDKPLPDYGDLARLAERSLGHTLTPIAVLFANNTSAELKAQEQIVKALTHYLIARQLNDDAHDWQADLRSGRVTCVVGAILSEMDIRPGRHLLDEMLPKMQQQFWYHTLPAICRQMRQQAALSRQALQRSLVMRPANVITDLLDDIEVSINDTLSTQAEARNFLKHYKQKVRA